jgi:hypothetical protein
VGNPLHRKLSERRARSRHAKTLEQARRELNAAHTLYEAAVNGAEKALRAAGEAELIAQLPVATGMWPPPPGTPPNPTLLLYDDRLITPDASCWLSSEVSASVDTAGQITSRIDPGRVVLFGVAGLLARKQQDRRELYVMLESPEFTSVHPVHPNYGLEARQFAAQVNTQVKRVGQLQETRAQRIAAAEAELERVRSDRSALEKAEATLAALEAN